MNINITQKLSEQISLVGEASVGPMVEVGSDPYSMAVNTRIPSVKTHELMDQSDLIIVHRSTVGAEAAYRGKPVVQIGKSNYGGLGSTYEPTSLAELERMLLNRALPPLGPRGAYLFAFWREDYIPYKYYTPTEPYYGPFRGVKIECSAWVRLIQDFSTWNIRKSRLLKLFHRIKRAPRKLFQLVWRPLRSAMRMDGHSPPKH